MNIDNSKDGGGYVKHVCFDQYYLPLFQERVRLKFRISYSISGNQTTDVGEAEDFPIQ